MNSYVIVLLNGLIHGRQMELPKMNIFARLHRTGLLALMLMLSLAASPNAFAQAATAPAARANVSPPEPSKPAAKPRAARERSPAQKANDDRMRACGTEWRAKKAELSAKGETWRKFSVDCRARLKAKGA